MPVFNCSTRVMEIQSTMSERAIELLNLPPDVPAFILDIGCGSGLSGECLTEQGHYWVGVDIAPAMLSELTIALFDAWYSQDVFLEFSFDFFSRCGSRKGGGR